MDLPFHVPPLLAIHLVPIGLGRLVGGFWGWLSGGGNGAILGIVVCFVEPLLTGAYFYMAFAGMVVGMLWGAIGGTVCGAIGGATASSRIGLLAGISAGVCAGLTSGLISPSQPPQCYAIALFYTVLLGVPAAVGGYNGGRTGRDVARD